MNPLDWKSEHLVALLLAMVIGAIVGVIVGYFVYAAAYPESLSFAPWIKRPFRYSPFDLSDFTALWWSLLGAAVGAGLVYIRRLNSN